MFESIYGARTSAGLIAGLLGASAVQAQGVTLQLRPPSALIVRAGEIGNVSLVLSMNAPWYVYAPTGAAAKEGLVETRIHIQPNPIIQFAAPAYPRAQPYAAYDVWRGKNNVIRQAFRARPRTPAGEYKVRGYLEYQTCDGSTCLAPDRISFTIPIRVTDR